MQRTIPFNCKDILVAKIIQALERIAFATQERRQTSQKASLITGRIERIVNIAPLWIENADQSLASL
jgi:hypothetical protein